MAAAASATKDRVGRLGRQLGPVAEVPGGTTAGATTTAGPWGLLPGPLEARSGIVLLGAGSSAGVPRPSCLLTPGTCLVCESAVKGAPEDCPNYRGNPSMVVRYFGPGAPEGGTAVMIDCGKTFNQAAIRWFPRYGITKLDAVVITHAHADAVLGIDDLRGLERRNVAPGSVAPLPIYLNQETYHHMEGVFPYLISPPAASVPVGQMRRVAAVDWRVIDNNSELEIGGLRIRCLPVWHGDDLICLGFAFGVTDHVVYLSDLSRLTPEAEAYLEGLPVALLIIDCLFRTRRYFSHLSMPESLDFIRKIRPRKALLVGLSDDFDYESDNAELGKLRDTEGLDVQMARDGLAAYLDL